MVEKMPLRISDDSMRLRDNQDSSLIICYDCPTVFPTMNAQPLKNGQMILSSSVCNQNAMPIRNESAHVMDRRAFAEKLVGAEWAEWYCMSPEARFAASQKLWPEYLALGGSLDPEVDLQSPFYTADEYRDFAKSNLPQDSR